MAVIYYTGHGVMPDRSPFYLLTVGSQEDRLEDTALETRQFLTLVQRREGGRPAEEQPEVLVILDCCYSGAGGMEALKSALEGIGNPRTWIIASAGPLDWAQQGRFASRVVRRAAQADDGGVAAVSGPGDGGAGGERRVRR